MIKGGDTIEDVLRGDVGGVVDGGRGRTRDGGVGAVGTTR